MTIEIEQFFFQIADRSKSDKDYENGNDCNRNKEWLPACTRRSISPENQNCIKLIFFFPF